MALFALRHQPTGIFLQIIAKAIVTGVPDSGSSTDMCLDVTGGVEVGHLFRHVMLVVDDREILETLIKTGFAEDFKYTPMTLKLDTGAFREVWTAEQLEIVELTPS